MKCSSLSKAVGAGIISLSLATAPLLKPAVAQNAVQSSSPSPTTESSGPSFDTTPFQETKNDNNNFGWLGLIGLLGLAKLFQKRRGPERYRDPNVTTSTDYVDPNVSGSPGYIDPNATNRPD